MTTTGNQFTSLRNSDVGVWTGRGCCLRLLQVLSTCIAFSLVASMGTWRGDIGNFSLFIWCFCFAMTLIIIIVEWFGLQRRFPFFWYNVPITFACYFALLCLSASITYTTTFVQFLPLSPNRDRAIAAITFSCIACVLYGMEVAWIWDWYELGSNPCYVHTIPGLLKVLETLVACVIFAFISNTNLYLHQPALVWCVVVYSICFIQAAVAILLKLFKLKYTLPIPFPIFQVGLTLLSVIFYSSAMVLWPLYQFDEKLGGQAQRSSDGSCRDDLTYYVCAWDQRLAVAILTAINLLAYMADLVYWARQVFVKD
ncbi:myeloid-associated differentiation marker-like [Vicugna pacos]|uniref:Myeloid-associated differentiation marker-like n=1 Tax=Vicugna pacos TaxID=30538 RepID=A0A6I9HY17_VICPA